MAPPKRPELSIQDHEYAIRELNSAVEMLNKQCEQNETMARQNHEDLLVIKLKIGWIAAGSGLIAGGVVSAVVKLLTH